MPVVYILISVFVFSLWALMAALGIEQINIWEFIFWIELITWVTSVVLLKISTLGKNIRYKKLRDLNFREVLEFSASGFTLIVAQATLLMSFRYMQKAGAMIVYEVWPILAMFVTPLFVARAWERVKFKDFGYSLLALLGVAMILLPEKNEPFFAGDGALRYVTLLLPLIGGIFNALTSSLNVRLSHATDLKDHPFIAVMAAQAKYGLFALGFAAVGLVFNKVRGGAPSHYTLYNVAALFFISIVIYMVGRLTWAAGLLGASNANITVLWYLTPVLTVAWLWLAGQSAVTAPIVIGSCFIISANMLMSVKADERIAYPATILTLLATGIYARFIPGLSMGDYYQAISVPLIFYAIIVAFLMDRLIRRDTFEEGLVVEIIRHIGLRGPKSKKKQKELVDEVAAIVRTDEARGIDAHYRSLRNAGHEFLDEISDKLDALALSRIQGASFGEMLVLSLVGTLTVATTVVFRPVDFVADCFSVVLSAALVFIYFTVIDLITQRSDFFLEVDEDGKFHLSPQALRSHRGEIVLSAVLIFVIIAAMVGVMWFKYK